MEIVEDGLAESEAGNGGAVLSEQVGVVGFVCGIGGKAKLLGGKRVDDAGFEAGLGESTLGSEVVVSGAFDGDDEVLDAVLFLGVSNQESGGVEMSGLVFEGAWLDEQISHVIGHQPLRALFGGIDTNEGELFSADLLDPWTQGAVRLLHGLPKLALFPANALGTIARMISNVRGHLVSPLEGRIKHIFLQRTAQMAFQIFFLLD